LKAQPICILCYNAPMKELLALGATILIAVAYVPYIKDIIEGKTKPHVYSWFISALVTFIAFGLQLSEGAGWGMLPTFVAAIASFVIFALALKHQKRASITKSDTFFFVMSLIAVILWLIVEQPLLSVIIISAVDILAFVPTFRKSWSRPDQETVSAYAVNSLRFTLATMAVQKYSLVTVLYPLSQALADGIFSIFLILRRRTVADSR
jgi:hypothetical protein